jgi:hypothetical protein
MSLNATVGGASANSFLTVDEATAYFANRLYASAWTGNAALQAAALITATQRLNQEEYCGSYVTLTQALKWPRVSTWDPDGRPYAFDAIPQALRDATCELALELLKNDLLAEVETKNLVALKAGPVELQFKEVQRSGRLPEQVRRLIQHVLETQSGLVRMVRG